MSMAAAISTKTVSGNNKNSGSAAYRCSDEEDSSILADLAAMFPSLDHDVLVSVLQAHGGRVQTTVEYLLTNNCGGPRPPVSSVSVDPAQDMLGLFSVEEIGGLPEILPRFACEEGREDTGDDGSNNESQSVGEVQEMGTQSQEDVIPDNDPLPTYAEACDGKKPASVLYVSHEQNELCFVKDTRGPTCYVDIPSVEQSEIAALVEKKSSKLFTSVGCS